MITFPNAKINIGLNVVEKRPDGYHNLETIFYPLKLSDALELIEADTTTFSVSGIQIDSVPENNLVVKAYNILCEDYKLPPVKLHLHKVIPFGAGLGGGSSDAAFTLKMLSNYFNLGISPKRLKQYAAKIGADCPFFIENKPTFAYGIGDQFKPVNIDLSAYEIVILKPNCSVNTPQAYKNITAEKPVFNLTEIEKLSIEKWKHVVKNDFEKSVFPQFPEVQYLKEKLYELGAVYASMSGSGSAVFGIFRHLPVDIDKNLPKGIFIYR
ncbi:MAG TPA: 4-(cytidine 5'-diphospho)-2-C-methyl-D-erythritol kinase [Draconibacterium sp.]|nr:4-(cytidine 5'-diphospho)-2-C-methyl-D-erythritol kinase [Draconibacterium sp.]